MTKTLREAFKKLVVEKVDESGASALPGGRGRGRGADGVGRVRTRAVVRAWHEDGAGDVASIYGGRGRDRGRSTATGGSRT